MRRSRVVRSQTWRVIGTAAFLAFLIPMPVQAGLSALVPAYFDPTTVSGAADWSRLATSALQIPITAIMNPASGPGSVADVNKYTSVASALQANGSQVVGYINTYDFGTGNVIPIATIKTEIDTYLSSNVTLNGFFLDNQELLPKFLTYYQGLYHYITTQLGVHYSVVGNPGIPFLNGLTPDQFVSTADTQVIFEGPNTAPFPGAPGFDAYPYGINWFQSPNYPRNRFSNIIYDAPTVGDMQADIVKAYANNAGYVSITNLKNDSTTSFNPYQTLPSYWDQEVSSIHRLNSVPEPDSLTALVSGGVAWILALAVMRLRRRPSLA